MGNPCNIRENKDINSIFGYCFQGMKRFERDSNEVAKHRHQIGMAMNESPAQGPPGELVDQLKSGSAILEDKYQRARSICDNEYNFNACGYAYAYECYVKMFGHLGELRKKTGISTEVKFKPFEDGGIVTDIAPESVGREVIFDTGAPLSAFSLSYYNETKDDFSKIAHVDDLWSYSGETFEIGAVKFAPEIALVEGVIDQLEGSDRQHRLIAIFGTDLLLRQPVEINHDRSVVVVNQDVRERLKGKGWSATPIDLLITRGVGYFIGIDASINGVPISMLLDTGAEGTSLVRQCEEKFPKERGEVEFFTLDAGGGSRSQIIPNVKFGFGGREVLLPEVGLAVAGSYISEIITSVGRCGKLGNDVLSNFNFIIDPVTMLLYSSPVSSGGSPHHISLNMKWSRKGNDWVIDGVANGGRAQKAGIKLGDKLIKLDGKEVSSLSFLQMMDLSYNYGDRVEVVFERDGKRSTVQIGLSEKSKDDANQDKTSKPPEVLNSPKGCGAHLGARP